MPRTPRRYAVHLHLVGGQTEQVYFPKLEMFQEWYQGIVNAEGQGGFVNVPIVKFSVDWWNTLHQPASVSRFARPALHADFLYPLFLLRLIICYKLCNILDRVG